MNIFSLDCRSKIYHFEDLQNLWEIITRGKGFQAKGIFVILYHIPPPTPRDWVSLSLSRWNLLTWLGWQGRKLQGSICWKHLPVALGLATGACLGTPGFHLGSEGPNSGPQACTAVLLPPTHPQTLLFLSMYMQGELLLDDIYWLFLPSVSDWLPLLQRLALHLKHRLTALNALSGFQKECVRLRGQCGVCVCGGGIEELEKRG